ncbi:MAG TPA: serine/threonine-protein kinase [Tepidisphaeraceae bacterium]|nr:serine/threonine-protein kinase [Tepidisphaeraceae bacterium]
MTDPSDPSDEGSPTIEPPMAAGDFSATLTETSGTRIGRYKLLEQIGEGGFGVVFTAEQEHPIRRRVALKIIKPGMDTRQVVARFEAERQALAMMDHPNIAKVLDGGSTDTGRPYFVMELVRGIPINEYSDQHKLDVKARLDLFLQVCHAIQHAHQKGLIHRDLKSSNVLVSTQDDQPLAKVIDFGIAKATQARLTDKTLYTNYHQMVGTPAYMSPEQAQGDFDIDTRSDVYSLGVILYELLVGSLPFDPRELESKGMVEMQRIIREVEPPPPSTRLSTLRDIPTVAARREVEPGKLKILLRGELDWIAMRCLEKDRKRRYQSVGELCDDIQRYLNDEQVHARPATKIYRLKKFVRRNKTPVIAASFVLLALLGGMSLAMVGFLRANAERNRAMAALADAQQQRKLAEGNFREAHEAVEDVLRIANDTLQDRPGLEPLRLSLTKAAIDRYEPFLSKPMADPTPKEELARLYAQYGLLLLEHNEVFDQNVMDAFQKAQAIQEQLLQEHPGDRSIRMDLGWTFILEEWRPHKMSPSQEESGRRAIMIFRKLVAEDPSDPFARDNLVWALWRTVDLSNQNPEALPMAGEAVQIAEQLVREYPASAEFRRELATSLVERAWCITAPPSSLDSARKALALDLRALDLRKAILSDIQANRPEAFQPQRPADSEGSGFHPTAMWCEGDLGWTSRSTARLFGALGDWRHAAEMDNQSATAFEDLVRNNPSVATFGESLVYAFSARLMQAQNGNERAQALQWSEDALNFWNRLIELHPELPMLKDYAQTATKEKTQLTQWLAKP